MRKVPLLALLMVCALLRPASAFASVDFIDWLEQFSGPGPFYGHILQSAGARILCVYDEDGHRRLGTCLSDTSNKIKFIVSGQFSWTSSHDNPRFFDAPATDTRNRDAVHASTALVDFSFRVHPMLDIGVGVGTLTFTGDGFDNQTHAILTPLQVTLVPFGMLRGKNSLKWGRVLRISFAERYVMGDISAADFNSLASYFKNGELNRSISVGVDIFPLLVRTR